MDETLESPSTTADGSITHVYLGSRKKQTTLLEFIGSSPEHGLTYSQFRKLLEEFLNKFYQAHNIPREKYLVVRGDQEVMSNILLFKVAY